MTREELLKRYPNASESFIKANIGGVSSPQPQCPVWSEPLAAPPHQAAGPRRTVVRITGFRKRLLDPDNFAGGCKYLVDGLRYCGLIRNDTPEDIVLETAQVKVTQDEKTEIEISDG